MVKNLTAIQETWVRSLGWEDTLEKRMATYSSILAWRIPWTKEYGELQSMGSQRVGHEGATNTFTFIGSLDRGFAFLLGWLSPTSTSTAQEADIINQILLGGLHQGKREGKKKPILSYQHGGRD